MAIAVLFELPPGSTLAQYDAAMDAAGDAALHQPARLYHVCYRTDTGFGVLDVWDSEEAFAAFGEILGPASAKAGIAPTPHVYPAHQIITQTGERQLPATAEAR
ncbi:hypothetical protein [Pseudonocardia sp. GCM10023141]|uniref:hypothetical protein n=1 Tax=Pseudonocardia sp. GCM10023141 TaxID=3252653 RepID=UPI0036061AB5